MRFQRRQRTTFSKHQLDTLTAAFKEDHYPQQQHRDYLAKTTNLDPKKIQVWFQNQRAKDRKRRGLIGVESPSPIDSQTPNKSGQYYAQPLARSHYNNETGQYQPHLGSDPEDTNLNSHVCIFSSSTANEAARAVSEGKCENIVEYHRIKYGLYS